MAERTSPVTRHWPGLIAAAFVAAFGFSTLLLVALRAESWAGFSAHDWAAVRFTILQAGLSALFSVVLAVPVARALARRRFAGRSALVTLLGAPFILPVIVAVLGLLAVFGRSGLLSDLAGMFGLPPMDIYGLRGIVLAHVFLNLPLATRILLQGWAGIPAERFRLAATLGMGPAEIARHLERPMLRAVLPGAFTLVFIVCTTSFAVALALGGGPQATTIELAIYQAFRFDFDLGKAALLSLVQFGICFSAALVAMRIQIPSGLGRGLDRPVVRYDAQSRLHIVVDAFWILTVALFLIVPLLMIVWRGAPGLWSLPPSIWVAALRSLLVALSATALTLALGLSLALAISDLKGRTISEVLEALGYLSIAASPLVIGTGLFIAIYPFADPAKLALVVTAGVNAMMALPFVLRILLPAVCDIQSNFGPLAQSLGIEGINRLRLVFLPRLRRPMGFSAGLVAALSVGDLGVIALFSDPARATLPLQLYRLMASYQMGSAMAAALILLVLALGLFWAFDKGGQRDAEA